MGYLSDMTDQYRAMVIEGMVEAEARRRLVELVQRGAEYALSKGDKEVADYLTNGIENIRDILGAYRNDLNKEGK